MEENANEFTPRAYQIDLYETAHKQNTIIYLPTGSGKTFIAVMLIKALSADIRKPYNEGGKHTVFLVNTVPLVTQQSEYIARTTGLACGGYCGDMGVDCWKDAEWAKELQKYQVLVMTSQILLDAICHGYILLSRINLLILDECHRAVSDHPMRQIMQRFQFCPKEEQPKVLGLTATLLNCNTNMPKVDSTVQALETTLHAKIATVNSASEVQNYYGIPKETIAKFDAYIIPDVGIVINNLMDKIIEFLNNIELLISFRNIETSEEFKPKSVNKKLKSVLLDIREQFAHAGIYGASKSILLHMIQIECIKKNTQDVETAYVLEYFISEFTRFRKLLEDEMKDNAEANKIHSYSSDQVRKLFAILKEFHRNRFDNQKFCCIIFVQRRFTASVLYHVLKNLSRYDEEFKFLKPDYLIGFSNDPYKTSKESVCLSKWNMEVLHKFKNGSTNCVLATDVVDEGIDIPTCTLIVRYNLPMDIRSYIQSKGRARYMTSQYTLLLSKSDSNYISRLESFKRTESYLQKLLIGQTQYREDISEKKIKSELYSYEIEPYTVVQPNGTVCIITEQSAISIINIYCAKLMNLKYVCLAPTWKLYKIKQHNHGNEDELYKVSLKLPIVSPVKTIVEGDPMVSIKCAKRSAALKMCIELHKHGELSDKLIPKTVDSRIQNLNYLFPNWEEEDKSETKIYGTYKKKRHHKLQFPSALYSAYPLPNEEVYLHLLQATPTYSLAHDDNRSLVFYNLLSNGAGFGILSSKRMPQVPSFPIFMNVGELQVDVKINDTPLCLSATEMKCIKAFHDLIFSKVVRIIKSFMVFDNYNRDNCFLIVPVNENNEINWKVIHEYQQIQYIPPPNPFYFEYDDYELALVEPNYRAATNVYVVTQVCEDLTPSSCFPTENFYSYVHYYKQKHGLTIKNSNQPMLEVKTISKKINYIKPRRMQSESKKRKCIDTDNDLKEHLVPELCTIIKFPALYWLKATMLPSILHRVSQLLIAEDLRCTIAKEANLGLVCSDNRWPSLVIKDEEREESLDSIMEVSLDECVENPQPEPVLSGPEIDVLNTDALCYPWEKDEEPQNLFKTIEDVRMIDIEHYCQFMTSGLKILSTDNSRSPDPVQITYVGNDAFDLERLETLGDAYLKFIVSLFLYTNFPDYNEGPLTALKGKIIGNRNLYYCGTKKLIPGRIKVDDFIPLSNFIAPTYAIFRPLQELLLAAQVSPNVLYEIHIPKNEQFNGCVTEVTQDTIKTKILNWEQAELQTGLEHFLGIQTVSDKTVADCVEALIGVYLTNMGIKHTVTLLQWFEILPKQTDVNQLLFSVSENSIIDAETINYFMPWASDIEKRLSYKFQNRGFLLQAFTHPSFSANTTTECYQRLEFLGDAILDFLITCYIYENCGNLNPGALTDLRSALVNNITFACLAVRYGLHTALLAYAPQLNDAINRFVKFQEERDHVVNDELLWILLEENECNMAEYVDVPKALGDIFETTIGAIYLDCGKSLTTVWEIIYSLMYKEIDGFSKNIPKQPVRVIHETQGAHPQFSQVVPIEGSNSCMVSLKVVIAGKLKLFHGFGGNKKQAKSAAAKQALKYLLYKT
ncbi:Endoribonuclease Dicer [Dufourea novaeangliae]|uniref:ribonuclease III n=1 Tax=Dufourea novaeangliae TaxID=178035 RepID=A0A154PHY9_DUFNO|nr:Endoribonuclease Dicer [Dufourea novaeangliae]